MTIDEAIDKLQNIIIDDYGYVYSYIAFEEAHQIAALIEQQAAEVEKYKRLYEKQSMLREQAELDSEQARNDWLLIRNEFIKHIEAEKQSIS